MALRHHHSDSGLAAADTQVTEEVVATESAISWPASRAAKPTAPTDQPGWHHGFRLPREDELYAGNEQGESPRKGMGTSIKSNGGYHPKELKHHAFHAPDVGDLEPGDESPMGWD